LDRERRFTCSPPNQEPRTPPTANAEPNNPTTQQPDLPQNLKRGTGPRSPDFRGDRQVPGCRRAIGWGAGGGPVGAWWGPHRKRPAARAGRSRWLVPPWAAGEVLLEPQIQVGASPGRRSLPLGGGLTLSPGIGSLWDSYRFEHLCSRGRDSMGGKRPLGSWCIISDPGSLTTKCTAGLQRSAPRRINASPGSPPTRPPPGLREPGRRG